MATIPSTRCFFVFFVLFIFFNSVSSSTQNNSLPFTLTYLPLSHQSAAAKIRTNSLSQQASSSGSNHRLSFKYSQALIVSLPIGTPPQAQQMVLDTGSQLSWIQCHNKTPTTSFDPSLSSSFSILPCNHPICKPRVPDFTLPTTCDQNRLCHYSYFYADGTLAEGNLVREKITFSRYQSTPPVALGCATASKDAEGILGMNLGRLSFASQAKISKFSYCTPRRQNNAKIKPTGAFYLGQNPYSSSFKYVSVLTFPQSQRSPNFDPFAYTVGMEGIIIGAKRLDIPRSAFRPDAGGSGQTMIDSGTEYTYLVNEAYDKIQQEITRLVGSKLRKGYVYRGSLDLCFNGNAMMIGRLIGNMVFEFGKGVEIVISKDRVLDDVGRGVSCLAIGRSERLGVPSNIIGNFHQQNQWVEFDIVNRRVGFGGADCSKSV
ncbi:putative nepenthesin [Helianthus annuus]|uniref:Nepenthesin n=1 Tax=Helianthus annuus TaxID=4232 RepID=A0A251SPQ5_HELAN|nr:aspartic proteinase PCS1 [Helianthus annuus]KAF5769345.1 putative nepenthesin [Helianthus annuus]KAJ0464394.1 putative nepenthesin [Helianthus annuus]KAJ0840622.1 putative nepenthesin [Helianthus annuus]